MYIRKARQLRVLAGEAMFFRRPPDAERAIRHEALSLSFDPRLDQDKRRACTQLRRCRIATVDPCRCDWLGRRPCPRLPAMVRFKNRYLLISLDSPPSPLSSPPPPVYDGGGKVLAHPPPLPPPLARGIDARTLSHTVRDAIGVHFGPVAAAATAPAVAIKYVCPGLRLALLRVGRDDVRRVWAAVALITAIPVSGSGGGGGGGGGGQVMVPLRLRVLHAAATIKAASTVAAAVGRDAVLAAKVRGRVAVAAARERDGSRMGADLATMES